MKWPGWRVQLLGAMGMHPSPARMAFLAAWQECEGGSARFNPMNTTERVPGSRNYNSVGVQHYPDEFAGVAATLLTLRLTPYAHLVMALRDPTLEALQIAERSERSLAVWGTGSACIERILRGR